MCQKYVGLGILSCMVMWFGDQVENNSIGYHKLDKSFHFVNVSTVQGSKRTIMQQSRVLLIFFFN